MTKLKPYSTCCAVVLVVLFGTVQVFAADCPSAKAFNNFVTWNGVAVTTSVNGNTVTYSAGSTSNLSPVNEEPGIVALCVYPSSTDLTQKNYSYDDPTSFDTAGSYSFVAVDGNSQFVFKRSGGTSTQEPLDGTQYALGDATFANLPAVTGYLVHIDDQAECQALYPAAPSQTCFVNPDGTPPPKVSHWPLQGFKFYDANGNGVYDSGDTLIPGVTIRNIGNSPMVDPAVSELNYPTGCDPLTLGSCQYFSATTQTDSNGEFQFAKLTVGGVYGVCEGAASATGYNWIATTQRPVHSNGGTSYETQIFCPRHIQDAYGQLPIDEAADVTFNNNACLISGTAPNLVDIQLDGAYVNIDPGRGPVEFGNVCTAGLKGGLTLGFWSNKNGAKVAGQCGALALLQDSSLYLRNADGSRFVPGTYSAFQSWLLNATAKSMSYMLSAQMATMTLNIGCSAFTGPYGGGNVDPGALVYAPGAVGATSAGFVSLGTLVSDANTSSQKCSDQNGATVSNPTTTCYDPAASTVRTYQGLLQTYLNALNNKGGNVVQTGANAAACIAATTWGDCSSGDITNVENGVDLGINFIPPQP